MRTESEPNSDYTRTWSPSGEIEYAKLADGSRVRYLKARSGPVRGFKTPVPPGKRVIPGHESEF